MTNKPIEQTRPPRNNPPHICSINLWQCYQEYTGERIVFSINGVVKNGYPYAKERSWSIFFHPNQLNWVKDKSVGPETVKLLEEHIKNSSWHWYWQSFFGPKTTKYTGDGKKPSASGTI